MVTDLVADLKRDPNWNDGWYYDRGGIVETLTRMRITTLKLYGADTALADGDQVSILPALAGSRSRP